MTLSSVMDTTDMKHGKPNLKGDRLNVLLLILMYVLQCLPRSLGNAIQLILQNRKATYQEQAEFSLIPTTYTFKLVWAPIIDCMYSKKVGRRKTWVIPLQYLISILLLLASIKVDDWIGSEYGTKRPNIHLLTLTFFLCSLFASMQDVAVDGWALTMLQKRNVGQSGTCNNIGYAIGQLFGYVIFIVLSSSEFCNYFRSVPKDYGFIQFADFMFFWSVIFIVSTTLIFIFKKDDSLDSIAEDHECRLGLKESYTRLWQIVKIGPIQRICFVLITCLPFFGPVNGVAPLKLMDIGVPRDKFVLVSLPTLPALLILPFVLSRHLTKQRALRAFLASFLFRLILDVVYAAFIFVTPRFKNENDTYSIWYYGLLLLFFNLDNVADYAIWISGTAFTNHISDPRFGAMYATLFNTMMQIGNKWSNPICIWLVDLLTFKSCTEINGAKKCSVKFDGFYTEIILCTLMGIVWLHWAKKQVFILQKMDASAFRIREKSTIVEDILLLNSEKLSVQ